MHNKLTFLLRAPVKSAEFNRLTCLFVTESLSLSVLHPSVPAPTISAALLTHSEPRERHHQQQFLIGPPPASRYTLPRNKMGSPTDAAGPWILRSAKDQQHLTTTGSNVSLQHPTLFAQQITRLAPTQYLTLRSAGDARSVQLGSHPSPLVKDLAQPQLHANSSEQHCLCAFAPIETLMPMPMPLPVSPSKSQPQCFAPAPFVASSPSDPSENYDNLLVSRRPHNACSVIAPKPQQRHVACQPRQVTSELAAVEQVERLVHQLQRVQPQGTRQPLAQPQHPFAPPIPLHRFPMRPAHSDLLSDSELLSSGAQSFAFSAFKSERIESDNQHEQLLQPSARSSSLIR